MAVPSPTPPVLIRTRVLFACSVPGCRVQYSWIGAFHPASAEAEADDRALARHMASQLGWQFPEPGNRCPRHREEP